MEHLYSESNIEEVLNRISSEISAQYDSISGLYIPASEKNKANGVATLDENGKLVQLPTPHELGLPSQTTNDFSYEEIDITSPHITFGEKHIIRIRFGGIYIVSGYARIAAIDSTNESDVEIDGKFSFNGSTNTALGRVRLIPDYLTYYDVRGSHAWGKETQPLFLVKNGAYVNYSEIPKITTSDTGNWLCIFVITS